MAKAPFKIALLGVGNMGGAMLRGWIDEEIAGKRITVIDPNPNGNTQAFMVANKITHISSLDEMLDADILILALKPQIMLSALGEIADKISENTVLVSVAAGITIAGLAEKFPNNPIVRSMPNTPSQVREGVTVCVGNDKVSDVQNSWVSELLSAIGLVEWVDDEALIDAVTGVSGSGPAYVFNMVEAMAAAGVAAGLPADLSMRLARQTVVGAASLLQNSKLPASELRVNVTSPNGTTAAALEVLMGDEGLEPVMTKAVQAATDRSKELAKLS